MFCDELLVLAAIRSSHVLELYAVELSGACARASVDCELTFTAVIDLTDAVNVLVAVWDFPLIEQRQLDCRQTVL